MEKSDGARFFEKIFILTPFSHLEKKSKFSKNKISEFSFFNFNFDDFAFDKFLFSIDTKVGDVS